MNFQLGQAHYFDVSNIGDVDGYNAYMMFSNHYENIDIYNGVLWNYDSFYEKNHFDWTSSISWNYSDDLTFTLKGENLLDKAQTYNIFRINPLTGSQLAPINLSSFDQRISIELEYLF